ncbi:MAG: exonuclease SbcCD subunit D [Alistipes sp.]|nr:exonuclease SbcCD subunit D [Candidatus Alistipes equi]
MRILHTSDWHLGHSLYNYDREEEQKEMLDQITDIVRETQPDVFLLAGDVYHTSQPSSSVQTMFTNALVEIHDACPTMTIVVTAGNHDSGSKHEIFRTPWRALKVHMIGSLNRECPRDHVIEIPGKGYIVAIPYVNERNLPEGFFQQLLDIAKEGNKDGLPVIMTAHTTVKGCDFSGHDHASEYTVGGIDSFDLKQLGEGYDYLALGHIHHEQFVHSGKHNVRYSGTPLAVSFDENYAHSVSIVEIEKHGDRPNVRCIEIKNPHPLVTLPSNGWTTWEDAKKQLENFPNNNPAYIRLNVEIEDFLPVEANSQAIALTRGKQCRFCLINARRKEIIKAETRVLNVQEFRSESPIDIARRYAQDLDINFDDELQKLFREAQQMLEEDSRND